MAVTFSDLQTEFFARGFAYLNDAGAGVVRAKRWLNEAMHEINDTDRWGFLQASASGSAPLTISDLGQVESVIADGRVLGYRERQQLTDRVVDLTTTGAALFFYVTGSNTVTTWPVTSSSLTVRYLRVDPDMSGNTDAPSMPDRFRGAIIELAVAKAYRDRDNPAEAQVAEQAAAAIVQRMQAWNETQAGSGSVQEITFASSDW